MGFEKLSSTLKRLSMLNEGKLERIVHFWAKLSPLLLLSDEQAAMPVTFSHLCLSICNCQWLERWHLVPMVSRWQWGNTLCYCFHPWSFIHLDETEWVKAGSDRLRSSWSVNLPKWQKMSFNHKKIATTATIITTTWQPSHRALGQIGRPLEALGAPVDKTDPLDQPLLK